MTNNLSSSIKTKELNTLKYSQKHDIIKVRKGCVDMWNAFMVRGAAFTNNDIPYSPTTAFTVPVSLVSYEEAKTIHKNAMHNGHTDYIVKAFVHFFLDDQKFDGKRTGIWWYPEKALEILRHFAGVITPDFSTNADFPEPIKRYNFYRMRAFDMAFLSGDPCYQQRPLGNGGNMELLLGRSSASQHCCSRHRSQRLKTSRKPPSV